MSFGVWNEPKRNRYFCLPWHFFCLFVFFFFLEGGHAVFSPSTSVRRELHKYEQSCTQLQGDRTCKNAASFLLHVPSFYWVSDFTTLGMKVYLNGLNKAGKLVPRAKVRKKKKMFPKADLLGIPSHSYQFCVTCVAGLWNILLWVHPKFTQVCV